MKASKDGAGQICDSFYPSYVLIFIKQHGNNVSRGISILPNRFPARPGGVTRVAGKCTWCWHRLTKGKEPACVGVCPQKALIVGDLNDPESDISLWIKEHGRELLVLKADMGTHTSVKYIGINEEVR